MTEYVKLQAIMDEAYDLWKKNNDWTYLDFIDNITPNQREAVFLGNLNYQVENGGFAQWHDNQYDTPEARVCLLRLLNRLNTKESMEMHSILLEAFQNIGDCDEECLNSEDYHDWYQSLSHLDDLFYKVNNKVLEQYNNTL